MQLISRYGISLSSGFRWLEKAWLFCYVLIVFLHGGCFALGARLIRRQIVAIRISVVSPIGGRPHPFRSFQRLLHKKFPVFLEPSFRLLLHPLIAPGRMLTANHVYGEFLVGLEGGPILSEYRPPTFEIDHPHAGERFVRDLIDQVVPKYLEMLGEIAQLRDTAVPRHYVPWTMFQTFVSFLSPPPRDFSVIRSWNVCVRVCACACACACARVCIVYRSSLSATPGTFQGRKGSRSLRPETYPSSSVEYHISPILLRSVARIYGT